MDETARLKAAEAERAMRAMQAELVRSEAAEAMKAAPELPAAAGVDQPGDAGVSRALLDIARDRDELAMLAAPSIESEPEPGEVGASHSPEPTRATLERPAIDDQAEPVVRTVYYATDRARVERRPLDLAWPFALPGALLMGTLGCLPLARRFIKDAYQLATRLLVVSVGGLAVLATTGLALQNVVQADQRDHMLAVHTARRIAMWIPTAHRTSAARCRSRSRPIVLPGKCPDRTWCVSSFTSIRCVTFN